MEKQIIGDCTLICGDCQDYLETLCFDAVVTDPPYGINADKGFQGAARVKGKGQAIKSREYTESWDKKTPEKSLFTILLKQNPISIIWGGNYFTDKLPQGNHWLVWDKLNAMPTFSDCELAWTNLKKNSVKKITFMQNGCMGKKVERFHPTQKPLYVMQWCIDQLKNPKIILDPFMGSGTTGVACVLAEKSFIGIEREKRFFDIACKRIEDAYQQPSLLSVEPVSNKPEQVSML